LRVLPGARIFKMMQPGLFENPHELTLVDDSTARIV